MDISSLRERENIGAFTVSELNNYIKKLFEGNRTLSSITVKGEISNFTNHRSGHLYFSLKDEDGQIRAVMFRSRTMTLKFMPESGMKVIVHGAVTVYPRDGSYQIYVSSMQPDGIGALYLAYEQLKERLAAEGLFSEEHKKPIPYIPKGIGVITSPTGAAVRDIINVATRRFPLAAIYVYPALVQGEGAEDTLISGIEYFDKSGLADVVIIGRGGGSIEDLWAFNSESLARRIYQADVPVISAVGHETDFTICDFVADLRAPTPSAAAELAVPDKSELLLRIDALLSRGGAALKRRVERSREKFDRLCDSFSRKTATEFINKKTEEVNSLHLQSINYITAYLQEKRGRLAINAEKLNAMNPLTVLSRGYAIVEGAGKGKTLISVDDVKPGDDIFVRLSDGTFNASVTEIRPKRL